MHVTLKVKSTDAAVKAKRESSAQRVLAYFGDDLPPSRLLCFFDDEDRKSVKKEFGPANRGFYEPIHDNTDVPSYVESCIWNDDGEDYRRVVDDLVYLCGSACAHEVGLTMTLAHELQHAVQHAKSRGLWAANSLIHRFLRDQDQAIIDALMLKWIDLPTELEARIVSKRVAEQFFGEERVRQYVDGKIAEHIDEADAADWRFIRTLISSSSVDLVTGTQQLFNRLKDYRAQLEAALHENTKDPDFADPDFVDLDLADYFGEAQK